MEKSTLGDWQRIKKVIDSYGMRKGFKKGVFLSKFIVDVSADINYLDRSFGDWQNFYKKMILVLLKTYPDMPLKKFLDENGNYTLMEHDQTEHIMNEEIILKNWQNSLNDI